MKKCPHCNGTGKNDNIIVNTLKVIFMLGVSLFDEDSDDTCSYCNGKGYVYR